VTSIIRIYKTAEGKRKEIKIIDSQNTMIIIPNHILEENPVTKDIYGVL
jgi:hypothetical protein